MGKASRGKWVRRKAWPAKRYNELFRHRSPNVFTILELARRIGEGEPITEFRK